MPRQRASAPIHNRSAAQPRRLRWVTSVVALGLALSVCGEVRAQESELQASGTDTATAISVKELADRYIGGDAEAKSALAAQGPAVLGELRADFTAANRTPLLVELAERIARDDIERALEDEGTLIYYGQFAHLKPLGDEGGFALLRILRDEDAARVLRTRAALAIADITAEISDNTKVQLRKQLQALIDDFLTEEWCALEAGYLLARLGDRSFVDKRVAEYSGVADQEPTLANVPEIVAAQTELAEVHYRIADYANAVKHYRQKRVILLDLRSRVAAELRPGIDDEIALLDYNLSCSLSLAQRFDEAFASLEAALAHRTVTIAMVETDGDLRPLRATPQFAAWFAEQKQRKATPGSESTPGAGQPPTEADRDRTGSE